MSRRVVEEVRRMPEHHRYLRGMRSWVAFLLNARNATPGTASTASLS
jgi:leucyl aminopeptidase